MKNHEFDEYIVSITPEDKQQEPDLKMGAQLVFDPDDKSLRLDLSANDVHHHVGLNRKQALKMIKLLEEFVLHNR